MNTSVAARGFDRVRQIRGRGSLNPSAKPRAATFEPEATAAALIQCHHHCFWLELVLRHFTSKRALCV